MLAKMSIGSSLVFLFFYILFPSQLFAELPPGAYEQLQKEAKEVYSVKVTKTVKADAKTEMHIYYKVYAKVLSVERSAQGRKPGDEIVFLTCVVPRTALKNYSGPRMPGKVPNTWKGKVWLNPSTSEWETKLAPLVIAAYAKSFKPEIEARLSEKVLQRSPH